MVNGINKYEGKDRREQRRKNHTAHDLRNAPRVTKERKKSHLGDDENDGFFFEDRYYDDQTTDD